MPSIRLPRHLGTALGLMLFVSCSNPAGVCGCDPMVPGALLYGRVTDAAGAPVANAAVTAEHAVPDCAAAGQTMNEVRTGDDGRYRMHVLTPGNLNGRCLRAFARPQAGSTLRASDTVPFTVRFSTGATPDSVRVDLALRAP